MFTFRTRHSPQGVQAAEATPLANYTAPPQRPVVPRFSAVVALIPLAPSNNGIYRPVKGPSIIYYDFFNLFDTGLHGVNLIRARPLVQVDNLQVRLDVLHRRAAAV